MSYSLRAACGAFFVAMSIPSTAQDLLIKRIEVDADKLYVIYDLADTAKGRSYTVNLYSSRDNYVNPIEKLAGDAGLEVYPGTNKRIEWRVREDLGINFEGKVAVELRAKVYIPFIRLEDLSKMKKIKRGKPTNISWTGGRPQNILNFELFNADETKVATIPNVANVGSHDVLIPLDVKPGKGYRFKISDSKNKDEVVFSTPFVVARKIPLLYKILPGAAVAGAAAVILMQKEEECPGCIAEWPTIEEK